MTREHGKRFDRTTDRQAATDTAKAMFADVWHDTAEQREGIERDVAARPQTVRRGNLTIPVVPKQDDGAERSPSDEAYLTPEQQQWAAENPPGPSSEIKDDDAPFRG